MKKQVLNIRVVGCGGIGGCLLNVLPRYLAHLKDYRANLTLIDGDSFEEKNADRQAFGSGFKADVLAKRLQEEGFKFPICATTSFITDGNVFMHIKEGDIVFSCVDNDATRLVLSNRCDGMDNVVLISGSNTLLQGGVLVHIRKGGTNVTNPITKMRKNIQDPKDFIPGERAGCDVVVASKPQILWVNNMIAAMMGLAFYHYLNGTFSGEFAYDEVCFQGKDLIGAATTKKR